MKKLIDPDELLSLFSENEKVSSELFSLAKEIIDSCPAQKNVYAVPLAVGTRVRTADGGKGIVESFYFGFKGVQRYFVRLSSGESMNCSPKGIGRDIFPVEKKNAGKQP